MGITTSVSYSIEMIREEVRQLIEKGLLSRNQPIYRLLQYIPSRAWESFERELELNEYLLRDRISDLIAQERWDND